MFRNHADYLDIYIASIEIREDYDKWQDLSKSHPEDGPNGCVLVAAADWGLLKILHSVTPMVPTAPSERQQYFGMLFGHHTQLKLCKSNAILRIYPMMEISVSHDHPLKTLFILEGTFHRERYQHSTYSPPFCLCGRPILIWVRVHAGMYQNVMITSTLQSVAAVTYSVNQHRMLVKLRDNFTNF